MYARECVFNLYVTDEKMKIKELTKTNNKIHMRQRFNRNFAGLTTCMQMLRQFTAIKKSKITKKKQRKSVKWTKKADANGRQKPQNLSNRSHNKSAAVYVCVCVFVFLHAQVATLYK